MAKGNFHGWFLSGAWWRFVPALMAAAAAYGATYLRGMNSDNAAFRLSLAQFFFLLVSIVLFARVKSPTLEATSHHQTLEELGYKTKESWDKAKGRAEESVSQFRTAWLLTLACWALLYLIFCFLPEEPNNISSWAGLTFLADFFNAGSNAGILASYIVLAENTTDTHGNPFAWLFLIAIIATLELVFVVTFSLPASGEFTQALRASITLFGAIGGIVGGMVVGLLVGQLDNKHLDCPVWLLVLLFGYAAIQPLYPILQGVLNALGDDALSKIPIAIREIKKLSPAILIGIAGIFKLLLCLFLYYSISSGRLLFYCARTRTIIDSVDTEWGIFQRLLKISPKQKKKQPPPQLDSTTMGGV